MYDGKHNNFDKIKIILFVTTKSLILLFLLFLTCKSSSKTYPKTYKNLPPIPTLTLPTSTLSSPIIPKTSPTLSKPIPSSPFSNPSKFINHNPSSITNPSSSYSANHLKKFVSSSKIKFFPTPLFPMLLGLREQEPDVYLFHIIPMKGQCNFYCKDRMELFCREEDQIYTKIFSKRKVKDLS